MAPSLGMKLAQMKARPSVGMRRQHRPSGAPPAAAGSGIWRRPSRGRRSRHRARAAASRKKCPIPPSRCRGYRASRHRRASAAHAGGHRSQAASRCRSAAAAVLSYARPCRFRARCAPATTPAMIRSRPRKAGGRSRRWHAQRVREQLRRRIGIEDAGQPPSYVDEIDGAVMNEAADAVGDNDDAEALLQRCEAALVGGRGDPPARRLGAIAVAVELQRLPIVVLRIEADAEQIERRAGCSAAYELQHAMKVIAELAAQRRATRVNEVDQDGPALVRTQREGMTVLVDQWHVREETGRAFNRQLACAGAGDDAKSLGLPGERRDSCRGDDRKQRKKDAGHHASASWRNAEGNSMTKFSTRINSPNTASFAPTEATRSYGNHSGKCTA